MAFGQQSGPPATSRQVKELMSLVTDAGHVDLRDARGPLGLTQRQAGGKFTRDEADALIEQLRGEADAGQTGGDSADAPLADAPSADAPVAAPAPVPRTQGRSPAVARRRAQQRSTVESMPDELLAGELQRRGWVVMAP